jgi:hypothetical protein
MTPDAEIRARIAAHWESSERADTDAEHAIYADDAILDYPQSGERFRGRSTIRAQRGGHPAERHFRIVRIQGGGDLWVSEHHGVRRRSRDARDAVLRRPVPCAGRPSDTGRADPAHCPVNREQASESALKRQKDRQSRQPR